MRGVTFVPVGVEITNEISTRTPHAGSDLGRARIDLDAEHFNPHSPCGE